MYDPPPPPPPPPALDATTCCLKRAPRQVLDKFSLSLDKLYKKRIGKMNLLPYRTCALQQLQQQDFLICPHDKNLGPAIIERNTYINIAMRDYLLDGRTYRRLSDVDCINHK